VPVAIKQWGRSQYETAFLTTLGNAIARAIPGAQRLNIQIEFRKNLGAAYGGARGAEGVHRFNPSTNLHVIALDKSLLDRADQSNLEYVCEVIAHEIGHAIQRTTGQLQTAPDGRGNIWEGQYVPDGVPWQDRPWEIDAMGYERYGTQVFQALAHTVPESAHQRRMREMEQQFPQHFQRCKITIGDLPDGLTRDQLLAAIEIMKRDPSVTLDAVLVQVGFR
jgi:hypothetical protein